MNSLLIACFVCVALYSSWNVNVRASSEVVEDETMPTVDADVRPGSPGTDDEVVEREEEQIKLDGMNVAQMKEMREKADKHEFVAEVTRMMKLIINSLYKNKEIFLRELISNASDALDKIRFLSVTDKNVLGETDSLDIRIKADKDNRMLHITDSGIGMTRDDLTKYLGTIAKSQTNEFLTKFEDAQTSENRNTMNDLIGQFGVGFYSAFLVADKVIVTSKHNDDEHQHVWESDSQSFTVSRDPRGNTLGRGTTVSLYLKEDALDFLEESKLREVVKKYSQFINFNIYLWSKKITQEDAPETPKEEKEASEEG